MTGEWHGKGCSLQVMYHHISKGAPEVCTSTRTILKANNLRLVLLFCDLLSLSHFLGEGFFTWVCLSHHIQFARSCWIVSLSLHIENSWDMPSTRTCVGKSPTYCYSWTPSGVAPWGPGQQRSGKEYKNQTAEPQRRLKSSFSSGHHPQCLTPSIWCTPRTHDC